MLISHSRRFIFIHVSKTAGSSVQEALSPFADRPQDAMVNRVLRRLGVRVNHWAPPRQRVFRVHSTALTVRDNLPAGWFDQYFSFGFVRNPWDWLVSLYCYLLKTPSHRHHERVAAMRGFREYVEFEAARSRRNQWEFICDRRGRVIVDFVGRFEHLQRDFAHVCDRIGVRTTLPHLNRSPHGDYRSFYRDAATVDLVAAHFSRDIQLMGYTFDAPARMERELHPMTTTIRASLPSRV